MMVIVLAYRHDAAAHRLVDRWRGLGEDAAVLTGADLSRRGWRLVPSDPNATQIVVGDRVIAPPRAVLVRMPVMSNAELVHVHVDDRVYAASEMQAFLLAWLTSLTCPVLNRPTTANLGGPAWHAAEWVRRARRLGFPARPYVLRSTAIAPAVTEPRVDAGMRYVDVACNQAFDVGGQPLPADHPSAQLALALARDADVEMLRAYVEPDGTFVEAGMWIDLDRAPVAEALTQRCFGYAHGRPRVGPAPATRVQA
jgi:hypothetical protein